MKKNLDFRTKKYIWSQLHKVEVVRYGECYKALDSHRCFVLTYAWWERGAWPGEKAVNRGQDHVRETKGIILRMGLLLDFFVVFIIQRSRYHAC